MTQTELEKFTKKKNDECASDRVFKAGDRIRLIRAGHGLSGAWVGRCATIKSHAHGSWYFARFDFSISLAVHSDMIEKISG